MQRWLMAAAGATMTACLSAGAMADSPGVTATEIKIGNTMPYSGPVSSYSPIGKLETAYLQDDQRAGRHRRAQDRLHLAGRWLQPAEDRRAGAPAGRGGPGRVPVQHAGHADQLGDRALREPEEGAASVRRDRCGEVGRREAVSVDHRLSARLPHRGADLRQVHPAAEAGRQGRRAVSERRFRQGLPVRPARGVRRPLRQDGDRGHLRADGSRRSTARSPRCRARAPMCWWWPPRRNSPRRRSARCTTSAGSRCSS